MEAASKANPPAAEFLRGRFIGTIVITIIFNIIITTELNKTQINKMFELTFLATEGVTII